MPKPYSKSLYQFRVPKIELIVQQKIIIWMAGNDVVHGTKVVDSSRYSMTKYVDWYNAKYGKISARLFAKLHLIHTPHGRICAAMVTPEEANDSPYLREMIGMRPPDSGDMLGDSAYRDVENCNAIHDSGCKPIIDLKSNAVPHGFNAKAETLRFHDKHSGTFYGILRTRNNVESIFSSVKERFGGAARALKTYAQSIGLLSTCICYNMTFA